MSAVWSEVSQRAAVPGSPILTAWREEQEAKRAGVQASAVMPTMWGGIDWNEWVRGNTSLPGVSESSARTLSAVHACIARISGAIAAMPLHFYRRVNNGREKYVPELWWLFNERPHPDWSAAMMWQYISDSRLLHGDGFVKIHRQTPTSPNVKYFEPLNPSFVDVVVKGEERWYVARPLNGVGKPDVIHPDDMLHIPGAGYNGVRSMSTLRYGLLRSGAIALSADEAHAQFFSDGVRSDFAIEIPGTADPAKMETLRKSFLDRHSGPGAKRAPIVLAGGMKLQPLTMKMVDAELLASRSFQVEEICRIFGVPPFMIGHTEKTTSWGSGIEQMGIGFVKYTLSPHLTAMEQEINYKLFKTSRNFCEFVTAGLERGDLKGRNEAYRIGLGRAGEPAWLTVNEVRNLENMPPVEGGDKINEPAPPNTGAPNAPTT
jgi:HK97 family phage portal protein